MREHLNDTYVQRAKAEGYRSRASYKLMEIDERRWPAPGPYHDDWKSGG